MGTCLTWSFWPCWPWWGSSSPAHIRCSKMWGPSRRNSRRRVRTWRQLGCCGGMMGCWDLRRYGCGLRWSIPKMLAQNATLMTWPSTPNGRMAHRRPATWPYHDRPKLRLATGGSMDFGIISLPANNEHHSRHPNIFWLMILCGFVQCVSRMERLWRVLSWSGNRMTWPSWPPRLWSSWRVACCWSSAWCFPLWSGTPLTAR